MKDLQSDPYIRMLFGANAVSTPVQIAVQRATQRQLSVVLMAQCAPGSDLTFGSGMTHQLVIGDAVIRPHAVLETDAFRGYGLAGLATLDLEDWINKGSIILNPAGLALAGGRRR